MVRVRTTIAINDAGHVGRPMACLAVTNGYHVVISTSRGPATLPAAVAPLGPRAHAATAVESLTPEPAA